VILVLVEWLGCVQIPKDDAAIYGAAHALQRVPVDVYVSDWATVLQHRPHAVFGTSVPYHQMAIDGATDRLATFWVKAYAPNRSCVAFHLAKTLADL